MSSHRVSRVKRTVFCAFVTGTLALASCGGSKSGSSDTSGVVSNDGAAGSGDSVAPDSAESLAAFCKSALDNQSGADIGATDDPAAIAKKLSVNAESLSKMAGLAPAELKSDAEAVATAAKGMADAITADPTLEKFNSLIEEFSKSDANAASEKVQSWVNANCEAGQ